MTEATIVNFGRAMLSQWRLDPAVTYLNHGTVGAPPARVLQAQQAIRDEIERQPARFLLRELAEHIGPPSADPPRMRVAAAAVGAFVGARADDLVFVDNATTGLNAVLQSLDVRAGDEVHVLDVAYGAIANAARFAAERRGAHLRTIETPWPIPSDNEALATRLCAAFGSRSRLLILDHISAETALRLPVHEVAARCRARGVAIAIDGAHAPGAIALDVPSIGADWYVGTLHKWAYAPRSSAFLWAAPHRQHELHPPVISWGLGKGFVAEFDWMGTRDPSAYLAAPEGIAFLRALGEDAVRRYNHDLAWEAGRWLSRSWQTALPTHEAATGTMITVALPSSFGSTPEDAAALRTALLVEDRIEVQIHPWRNQLWVRVSAQVYNDMADIERLDQAIRQRA